MVYSQSTQNHTPLGIRFKPVQEIWHHAMHASHWTHFTDVDGLFGTACLHKLHSIVLMSYDCSLVVTARHAETVKYCFSSLAHARSSLRMASPESLIWRSVNSTFNRPWTMSSTLSCGTSNASRISSRFAADSFSYMSVFLEALNSRCFLFAGRPRCCTLVG